MTGLVGMRGDQSLSGGLSDAEFDEVYRNKRPMVERSLAWPTRGTNRRLRFRGIAHNQLGWANRRAATNLQQLLNLGLTATDEGWAIA